MEGRTRKGRALIISTPLQPLVIGACGKRDFDDPPAATVVVRKSSDSIQVYELPQFYRVIQSQMKAV